MSRLELCQKLIEEAMRCLESGDKECVMKLIEELVRNQCHDGNMISKEIADEVRDVVYKLWKSDYGLRCRLLKMLRDSDITKTWVKKAIHVNDHYLDMWITECGIDWKTKATRSKIVEVIEDSLREKIGWSETWMCEELWRFIDVDVNEFRRHGIEPCVWLSGLEELSNLKHPYWLGLSKSDLVVEYFSRKVVLALTTTNTIDAIFFLALLNTIKTPSLTIGWKRAPRTQTSKFIALTYYIVLSPNTWPWSIKNIDELREILDSFDDEKLSMFLAGMVDGDGTVLHRYDHKHNYEYVAVTITACKNCPKFILDVVRDVVAERFGIIGKIYSKTDTTNVLSFSYKNAVKLLRRITKYLHHPLKRLRAELILMLYDGRIDYNEFERLYNMIKYDQEDDIKRSHGLETLARAAPQTHTHGESRYKSSVIHINELHKRWWEVERELKAY